MQLNLFDAGRPICSTFAGFDVVILRRDDKRRAFQLAMLDRMLLTGRPTTVCDVLRDLNAIWDDGGKWVGPAMRQLADDGLTCCRGVTYSRRPSRHGCPVHTWTLNDPKAAKQRAEQLRSSLQLSPTKRKDDSSAANTDEPSCS
ncbi:MAG: hypothetical protein ACE361_17400 [Aureliella sp.]